jgi:hypothetical protein
MAKELPFYFFCGLSSLHIRLFEEENKASEKNLARHGNPIKKFPKDKMQMTSTTVLQFQHWPTIQSNPILVLSDDED